MDKKGVMIVMGFIFVLTMIIFLSNLAKTSAQECRIIIIHGKSGEALITVEPETIFLSKGDCVVWFNRFSELPVKVKFEEGKRCVDVTKLPIGFSLNEQNCYVTSYMPLAGTSSLRFMEKGIYRYVVNPKGRDDIKAEGQIVVE
jgi:hypothetical protein